MSDASWLSEWDALLSAGKAEAIEEFWLGRLETGLGTGDEFSEALKRLRSGSSSKKTLAATLLELAADQALSDRNWPAARVLLAEAVRLGVGDQAKARAGLAAAIRHLWAGRPSLERLLQHFDLAQARKPLETLEALETWLRHDVGEFFSMAGRGAGRVVDVNPQLGMLRIDFERERRVPVPIDAAGKHLTPLPPGHFLRRKLEDAAALQRLVAEDPQAGLAAVLESFAEAMSVQDLKAALSGFVAEDAWTSWWNKARKHPRLLTSGSGARLQYRLAAGEAADYEIREEFLAADFTGRLELARRHGGRSRELAEIMGTELARAAVTPGVDPGQAWEAMQVAFRLGAPAEEVRADRTALLAQVGPLGLLEAIGDATMRELALEFIREAAPDAYVGTLGQWLEKETHPRILTRLVRGLVEAGQGEIAGRFVDQVQLQPNRYPAVMVWLCECDDRVVGALLDGKLTGGLLIRVVDLAETREFGPLRNRLREVISARGLAGRLVQEKLTPDQGRRLLQMLDRPGELIDERAWLRRAVLGRFPDLYKAPPADVIPALAGTVTRLQEELARIRDREIPETLKAIALAKEEGDLRENFEYHAARARQELLSARAARLQEDLAKVRVIDPGTIDISVVRVGTRVRLGGGLNSEMVLTILGPYEGDPDKGILSVGSEVAQALVDRAAGDTVSIAGKAWRIEAIERAVTADS